MDTEEEVKEVQPERKKKSIGKRILKVFLYIILAIVGLNLLLYVLLSIPAIQQKAKDIAVTELKKKLNTEIKIDRLSLSLFNNVTLRGIYIEDQAKDTLLYANTLGADLDIWQLVSGTLMVTGIQLDDFVINVNQKDSVSDFNFQFIIDAFAGTDTVAQDTTTSSLQIVIKDIDIQNGRLNYDVQSAAHTPGIFNPSHISIHDLRASIDLNSIDTRRFDIAVKNISAKEQTGLEVTSLKGNLYSKGDQLWLEGFELNLPDSYLITSKARYNLENDEFELSTQETALSAKDLTAFLPELKYLTEKITLKTDISGTLPLIDIKDIALAYGNECLLSGSAYMSDCMRYGISDIEMVIDHFKLSPNALTSFVRIGDSTFVAPDILHQLGDIYLKGRLTGKFSQFKLDAEAWSRQGNIIMAAKGNADSTFVNYNVSANLRTTNFNLGNLLGKDTGLGRLAMNVNLKARQTDKIPLNAELDGQLNSLEYESNHLKNIPFSAYYNDKDMGLSIDADLPIGRLTANASMSQAKIPDIHLDMKVDSLDVNYFYKNEAWVNPVLSFDLNGDIKGLDIDNMSGKVMIENLSFRDSSFRFEPGPLTLELNGSDNANERFISFTSSIFEASIKGEYWFATLADEMTDLLHNYIPNLFQNTKRIKHPKNNFTFTLSAQNTEELGRIFNLPIDIMQPSVIEGRVSMVERVIDIEGSLPYLKYGDIDIKSTKLTIANQDSAFNVIAGTGMSLDNGTYDLALRVNGANSSLHGFFNVKSDTTQLKIDGQIEALAQFDRDEKNNLITSFEIMPSDIQVGNLDIYMLPAKIVNMEEKTEIHNLGLSMNKKRYFGADGIISKNKSDTLKVYFDHAQIADILSPLNINHIEASINGNVLLTNLLEKPEVYTKDLAVSDIILFNDTLGTMTLESQWNESLGGVKVDAMLKKKNLSPALVSGFVYPSRDSLDMKVQVDRLPLDWVQPFVADMLNKLSGNMRGGLTINGKISAPTVQGWLGLDNTSVGIDYTNVIYTISDTIQILPNRIGFDNLVVKDSYNNKATVSATLTHKNFEDMKYTVNMDMNNLMVLNTEHRTDSLFYGKVFASGNIKVEGKDDAININMNVRNGKGSNINILIPQTSQATDYKSVVYINTPPEKDAASTLNSYVASKLNSKDDVLPLKLGVTLNVTPDLGIGIIIDPATGDNMQIKGRGQVKFTYNMLTEDMSTYGDYTATDGSVRINLQRISNLEFKIQEGSKLTFVGDPLSTRFDISAVRRVRADLKTLDANFGTDGAATRVPVNCILGIKGSMDKMTISYDIALPEVSDDIQQKVKTFIVTDEQKVKQFAYLVAFGSFYSSSGGSPNIGSGLWTNLASATLSEGLNSVFGNILGDKWEVGTNIESNDGTLNDLDMSVNVSRKFLDDRLRFNTNLGYRTDNTTDNSFIGDFDVEYQLNNLWTIKAYNKTNDKYYTEAPTTQGIGIVYTREARTLKRLFRFWGNRRQRSSTDTDTTKIPTETKEQPAVIDESK